MPGVKRCHIMHARSGMRLGRPIVADSGVVLLEEEAILTDSLINRLGGWGFTELYISEGASMLSSLALDNKQKIFLEEHKKITASMANAFYKARRFQHVPIGQIECLANHIIASLLDAPCVFSYLHIINLQDDYTFCHSVNVAVISGIIAKWFGWGKERIKEVVLAGLLHDIGKARVPLEILNKPERLVDYEMELMQQHSLLGYELLAGSSDVTETIKLGILQHHERIDGSGYPCRIRGDKILPIAKIIAVADVYDAMTSDRIYQQALSPLLVTKELIKEMFGRLDGKICMALVNYTSEALLGSLVELSDGTIAKVVYLNDPSVQPVVQTLEGNFIELEGQKDLAIVDFIF